MDLIYRYELLAIHHDSGLNVLHVEWTGFVTSEEYRLMMREMVKFTIELGIRNWIFNLSQAERIQIGDFNWTTEYLGPILKTTKLKKIARVDEKNSSGTENISMLVEAAREKLGIVVEVGFFTKMDEAIGWLQAE